MISEDIFQYFFRLDLSAPVIQFLTLIRSINSEQSASSFYVRSHQTHKTQLFPPDGFAPVFTLIAAFASTARIPSEKTTYSNIAALTLCEAKFLVCIYLRYVIQAKEQKYTEPTFGASFRRIDSEADWQGRRSSTTHIMGHQGLVLCVFVGAKSRLSYLLFRRESYH